MTHDTRRLSSALFRSLRIGHWTKNLLVFVPLLTAHQLTNLALWKHAGAASLCFCLVASGIYLINDFLDLEQDRRHPHNRFRPFAAGDLDPQAAWIVVPVLWALGGCLVRAYAAPAIPLLFLYWLLALGYCFVFKRITVLDIIVLAVLHTLRVMVGGAASGIPISRWLMMFSLFIFLSLSCLKRFVELGLFGEQPGSHGRGYLLSDRQPLGALGIASGYASLIVFAFYIYSPEAGALYHKPQLLWAVFLVLFYWIQRIWLLAARGKIDQDTIVFAVRDGVSYVCGLALLALLSLSAII